MKIGMIGLGKMGANMALRLRRQGFQVVGYDHSPATLERLEQEAGIIAAQSPGELVAALPAPRIIWLMLPSGPVTSKQIEELMTLLSAGDVVVDGGNSNYHDSKHHGALLAGAGIGFMDAGTSGGVWGLENGYCLMVGGTPAVVSTVTPVLKALAPDPERGWAHVGPIGAGHFVKMIHNGIEYGMMQSLAEGLSLLRNKPEFALDLASITELWRHGSVIRSWLLDLTAQALQGDQQLESIAPFVADSGEGRWTAIEAIAQGTPAPVLTLALYQRFQSQDMQGYGLKLLSLMRNAFGGHAMKGTP